MKSLEMMNKKNLCHAMKSWEMMNNKKNLCHAMKLWERVTMMNSVITPWIDSNENGLFKPDSFNKVEETWIHKCPWELLNLISNPLWIDRVVEWGCANVISIPAYVKRGTLSTVHT